MNMYVWKGEDVWELVLGDSPQQAAEAMDQYFMYSNTDPSELELYGQIEETRSYYYGAVDPRDEDLTYPHPDQFLNAYGHQHPVIIAYEKQLGGDIV